MTPPSRRARRTALLALVFAMATLPAGAQGPDADWRTIELPHYRVHYPAPAEAWVIRVAARLESTRHVVSDLVGWTPEAVVDVLVVDPVGVANGSAWALPEHPRMVLFATPPEARSQVAFFQDWVELLVGHEQVHLTHLLRPARNRWGRWISAVVPVTPIARKAPRWVTEGYATLLEGKISGRGRPHAHLRSTVVRQWARSGRLPSYGRLASDRDSWLGMSMAYLVGSAYLQWLEDERGPEALPALWRRMTAREARSFDEAFRGVFGDSPAALYSRFTAELTHRALELEGALDGKLREGEVWQDFSWGTGPPAVSPDGQRIAFARTGRHSAPRLVVLATGPNEEAETKRRQRIEEILAADPDDVAPVDQGPLPREPEASLVLAASGAGAVPRWMPDGSVLFTQAVPDATGVLRWDLFRWWPGSGRAERMTRQADLRHVDPAPDGAWGAGLRVRWGSTEIVRVDLATGDLEPWIGAVPGVLLDSPRLSPDGGRLAYLRHGEGDWALRVRDVATGEDRALVTPEATTLAHPAWRSDGRHVYLDAGQDGLLDIRAVPVTEDAEAHRVTRSLAGAFAPAPTPDDEHLYYLSLDADGIDLRRLALDAATLQGIDLDLGPDLVPVVAPPPGKPIPIAVAEVPPSHPYGLGRPEAGVVPGLTLAPSGRALEVGVRLGDVVGRWNALALGAVAEPAGAQGLVLSGVWRGGPMTTSLSLFRSEESYADQPVAVAAGAGRGALDLDEQGVVIEAAWERFDRRGRWELAVDAGLSALEIPGDEDHDRRTARARVGWAGNWPGPVWALGLDAGLEGQRGTTADGDWTRTGARLALSAGREGSRLTVGGRVDRLDGDPTGVDRLRLGGTATSLRPPLADAHRFLESALPAGTASGNRGLRLWARLETPALPVAPFWRRYRLHDDGARGDWIDLTGFELALDTRPLPLLGLPAAQLRLGAAYVFDRTVQDEVTGWVVVVWRP